MKENLYPIKFYPLLKERIWGGSKLKSFFGKQTFGKNIGESWELSDVEGDTSIISNGPLEGKSLKDLLKSYKELLVGHKVFEQFGDKFPLLIKFIDAKKDLSVQLHPNDKLAKERHNSFGKTEMWYVMDTEKDSNLILDFKSDVTVSDYLENLKNKTLPNILNFEKVKKGDTYFIEVGRVHAIGAGVLLAEIQQTSDITYRIYDWDRVDVNGNSRELHTDLAVEAIDFNMEKNYKVSYKRIENNSNEMVSCPYFTTNFLPVSKSITKQNGHDSFLIYICVSGSVVFDANGFKTEVSLGETVLIPASIKDITLHPKEHSELLEVYIK